MDNIRIETVRATEAGRNSFGQYQAQDLGFDKKIYYMSKEDFESKKIPDGNYGIIASDFTRKFIEFKEWEDPNDCKYIVMDIKDGKRMYIDSSYDLYKSSLNFIKIEGNSATKAKNKYNSENYERISLSVPKGKKDRYRSAAESEGKSLNQFVIDCIEKGIE